MSTVAVVNPKKRHAKRAENRRRYTVNKRTKRDSKGRFVRRAATSNKRRRESNKRRKAYVVRMTAETNKRKRSRHSNKRKRSRHANRKRTRRASNPRRRHRSANRRRRYRHSNPAFATQLKRALPVASLGHKWGMRDIAGGAGGFVTTALVSGAAKMSGNEIAGPIAGGIYWVGSSWAFNKLKATRPYATGWFYGGAIAFVVDTVATVVRQAMSKPLTGLAAEELPEKPLDKIKTLFTKGVSDIQTVFKGLARAKDESFAPSRDLARVTERGYAPDAPDMESTLLHVQTMKGYNEDVTASLSMQDLI